MDKVVPTAADAVAGTSDGASIAVGGSPAAVALESVGD